MQKIFLTLMAMVSLSVCISCSGPQLTQDEYTFRKTRWGMTKEEVIQSEGRPPTSQAAGFVIFYDDELFGQKVRMAYRFSDKDDLLMASMYSLNRYDESFVQSAISTLTKKYGNPKNRKDADGREEITWARGDTTISVRADKDRVLISYASEEKTKEHNHWVTGKSGLKDEQKL